jgi:hypothetical protein
VFGRKDARPPLDRALEAAAGYKPGAGAWPAVEALSILAIETRGRPESPQLLDRARELAAGLSSGAWESISALAWLARAERELG